MFCVTMYLLMKGLEQLRTTSIKLPESFFMKVAEKGGQIPLAVVIRRLLEKWLKGEISLD